MSQRKIGKLYTHTKQNKLSSVHSKGINEIKKNWQTLNACENSIKTENLIKLFATLYQYIHKEMSKKKKKKRRKKKILNKHLYYAYR